MNHISALSYCHHDSEKFAGEEYRLKFLSLPRPRSDAENNLYFETFHARTETHRDDRFWLDISEAHPATDPRKWVYSDETPVSWTNWKDGEPNDHGDGEPLVEVDPNRFWNDVKDSTEHMFMCVYYLPVGAENACPWLLDYQD